MAWPWRLLAFVLFIGAMAPIWLIAKWAGSAIPDWIAYVAAGVTLGVWATLGYFRFISPCQGRVTIFPPD